MTAKEKALDLINSHLDVNWTLTTDPELASYIKQTMVTDISTAISCSLISVQHILDNCDVDYFNDKKYEGEYFSDYEFFMDVEQELLKQLNTK